MVIVASVERYTPLENAPDSPSQALLTVAVTEIVSPCRMLLPVKETAAGVRSGSCRLTVTVMVSSSLFSVPSLTTREMM